MVALSHNTKGHMGQVIQFSSHSPEDFGDLQGVFIHKDRAVTFYSPSGWEYQLCEPHQVCFQQQQLWVCADMVL